VSAASATPAGMIELFSVPWSQVELEHVRAFLDDAGEEGVTWEAKADDDRGRLRGDSIRRQRAAWRTRSAAT
jgi:hypothetical protein